MLIAAQVAKSEAQFGRCLTSQLAVFSIVLIMIDSRVSAAVPQPRAGEPCMCSVAAEMTDACCPKTPVGPWLLIAHETSEKHGRSGNRAFVAQVLGRHEATVPIVVPTQLTARRGGVGEERVAERAVSPGEVQNFGIARWENVRRLSVAMEDALREQRPGRRRARCGRRANAGFNGPRGRR